jgi:hypothetical protein
MDDTLHAYWPQCACLHTAHVDIQGLTDYYFQFRRGQEVIRDDNQGTEKRCTKFHRFDPLCDVPD